MTRRITPSIALVVSVILLSLMSSDRAVTAQPGGMRRIADTGIVPLGPNQILRLTAVGKGNADNLCLIRVEYGQGTCNGDGVCKHAISSQIESGMITLMRGEGASIDFRHCVFPICGGVRGVVLSSNRNTRVNALIINTITGEVTNARELALDDTGPFPIN